jgi:hypothetical protein
MTVAIIVLLIVIPYFLFGTKMHIEGDDSHLYYHYPELWIKNIANSSWMSYSSLGNQDQHFFFLPILAVFAAIKFIGVPTFIIQNLSFSAIFIMGFIFFQNTLRELLPESLDKSRLKLELLFGAALYIFSPIILISPTHNYLVAVWLVGVIPLLLYLLLKYIKTSHPKYLAISGIVSLIFSFALNSIPWLLGFILPLSLGTLVCLPILKNYDVRAWAKRIGIWGGVILLVQSFWLLPFLSSITGSSSLGGRVLSQETQQTFATIVNTTDQGNSVFDPLLNLFHRQLQEIFSWNTDDVYKNWYDYLVPLSFIYPLILIGGATIKNTYAPRLYWVIFASFLIALLFFTVRIGIFARLFLLGSSIPGFAMFRNFYDKFALGYTLLYATLVTLALIKINMGITSSRIKYGILAIGFIAILLNAKPFIAGDIINTTLERTASTRTNITIPNEYLNFMSAVGSTLPHDANMLDIPFGTSSYTVIKDASSNNAFSGKSPVKLFSGVNDFSGSLSFPTEIAQQANTYISDRNYEKLRHLLDTLNIHYIFETKNIPDQLLKSSLYDPRVVAKLDGEFRSEMFGEQVLRSSNGNYNLYKIKGLNASSSSPSFVPVSDAYDVSPALQSEPGLLPGALGYYLSTTIIGIGKTPNHVPSTGSLAPFMLGDKIDNPASDILVPNSDLYRISDIGPATLSFTNIGDSSYSSAAPKAFSLVVDELTPSTLLKIQNEYYDPSRLKGAIVSKDDGLSIYKKQGPNVAGNSGYVFQKWGRGDCNSYNSDNSTAFDYDSKSQEVNLKGERQHDACIFSSIHTNPGHAYAISFQYKTNLNGTNISVEQSGADIDSQYQSGTPNEWNNFTYVFDSDEDSATIHLYSGQDINEAITSIRNLTIYEYAPIQSIKLSNLNLNFGPSVAKYPASRVAATAIPKQGAQLAPLGNWSQGDCANIDGNPGTEFSVLGQNSIKMIGKNGHEACIYQTASVNPDYTYYLDFDYFSSGATGDLTALYGFKPDTTLQSFKQARTSNRWQHVVIPISTPRDAQKLVVYLYSGKNVFGKANTTYKNVSLTRIPKTYTDNLLITDKAQGAKLPHMVSTEQAPHRYTVTAHKATDNFFVNFATSFHPGWQLKLMHWAGAGSVITHFPANLYTNGWYVDVDKLCKQDHQCSQNADGSYDIEMVAEFTPQRWLNIGLAISAAALIGCLIYLIYIWRTRKGEKI